MFRAASFLLVSLMATTSVGSDGGLDFLIGEWVIEDQQGQTVGRSEINTLADSMLFERRTIGAADPQPLWLARFEDERGWTQLFLGPHGTLREFVSWSEPGKWPLVLGEKVVLQDGTHVLFRMTISRADGDESRRILEISKDFGTSWNTVFDYRYRRPRQE